MNNEYNLFLTKYHNFLLAHNKSLNLNKLFIIFKENPVLFYLPVVIIVIYKYLENEI